MKYKLVISGRLESLNTYIDACRKNKQAGAVLKRTEQNKVVFAIIEQLRNVRIEKAIKINFFWYEKNKRRDKDNVSSFGRKVILDALQETKVIKNDNWTYIRSFSDEFSVDSKNPRVIVEIEEISEVK